MLDQDGWLRTGDIATIDEDGFVTITDRKRTSSSPPAKNIAPQNLENDLKTSASCRRRWWWATGDRSRRR